MLRCPIPVKIRAKILIPETTCFGKFSKIFILSNSCSYSGGNANLKGSEVEHSTTIYRKAQEKTATGNKNQENKGLAITSFVPGLLLVNFWVLCGIQVAIAKFSS